ncbi:hypothetical protein AB0B79_30440 [Streptomyces sp. NPDC039022]|uniref:hypothetical protein n=1 Tax=Streptomyces sp. NPDC039022 TaxID=3157091 RepID=UPI0033C054E1
MNCLACTRALDNTARLCPTCTRGLDVRLADLPRQYLLLGLAENLQRRRSGDRGPVAVVRDAPMPLSEAALTLRAEGGIVTVLEEWRAAMQDARGWGPPAIGGPCARRVRDAARGLRMSLEWIAAEWDAAGDLSHEVRDLAARCRAVTDPADPEQQSRLLGHCVVVWEDGTACGADVRLPHGAPIAQCRRCQTTYPSATWLALRTGQPEPTDTAGTGVAA